MNAYKLHFKTPVRITSDTYGLNDVDLIIHSDLLFSAVISKWGWLFPGEEKDLLASARISLSSAFPFAKNTLFFPLPLNLHIKHDESSSVERKKVKGIRFLEMSLFEKVLLGEKLSIDSLKPLPGGLCIPKDYEADTEMFRDGIYHKYERERNTLDRVSNASVDVYQTSEIGFQPESGLFFMTDFSDEKIEKKFEAVLALLGDEGIGADRNIGRGHFAIEKVNLNLKTDSDGNAFINLSMFVPAKSEQPQINWKQSFYEIVERGGWITAPGSMTIEKKRIRMLAEGSVISTSESLRGNLVDITPQIPVAHPVYRSGQFFGFPVKV